MKAKTGRAKAMPETKKEKEKMDKWEIIRKVALYATAAELEATDTGENDYGYHISEIDGITLAWRYHKQKASNQFEPIYGNGAGATHIIITDFPDANGEGYEKRILKM